MPERKDRKDYFFKEERVTAANGICRGRMDPACGRRGLGRLRPLREKPTGAGKARSRPVQIKLFSVRYITAKRISVTAPWPQVTL